MIALILSKVDCRNESIGLRNESTKHLILKLVNTKHLIYNNYNFNNINQSITACKNVSLTLYH